jgi:hypothetical protein
MKSIHIKIKDGEKESELVLDHIDEEHKLSLVDGFFKFFDINVDFKELADIYKKSAKAYDDFFKKMDNAANYKDEKTTVDSNVYAETLKQEDYMDTGIKYDALNQPKYKCRYKCTCGKEANHYIRTGTTKVRCWECNSELKIYPATLNGEVQKDNPEDYRDPKGNYYIAGVKEMER